MTLRLEFDPLPISRTTHVYFHDLRSSLMACPIYPTCHIAVEEFKKEMVSAFMNRHKRVCDKARFCFGHVMSCQDRIGYA